MNARIVAIGGGEVFIPCKPPETLAIDCAIVNRAKQISSLRGRQLNFLFIPTASNDDIYYCNTIYNLYEVRLGCCYDHLRLSEMPGSQQIRKKIEAADIIYVGGGNTLKMMKIWKKFGVDKLLIKKAESHKVTLCGLSAGAICWFKNGVSDSQKLEGISNWKPMLVEGLGLLPQTCCPHYDSEVWRQSFVEFLSESGQNEIVAIEDNAALEYNKNDYRLINSRLNKRVYFILENIKTELR